MLRRISGEVKTTVSEAHNGGILSLLPGLFPCPRILAAWRCVLRGPSGRYCLKALGLSDSRHGRFATGTNEGVRPYRGARLRRRWTGESARPHTGFAGVSADRLGLVLASGPLVPRPGCGRLRFFSVSGYLSACRFQHVVFLAVMVDLQSAQEVHQIPCVIGLNGVRERWHRRAVDAGHEDLVNVL